MTSKIGSFGTRSGLQASFSVVFLAFLSLPQLQTSRAHLTSFKTGIKGVGVSLYAHLSLCKRGTSDPLFITGSYAHVSCAKDAGKVNIQHFLASLMVHDSAIKEEVWGKKASEEATISATIYAATKNSCWQTGIGFK